MCIRDSDIPADTNIYVQGGYDLGTGKPNEQTFKLTTGTNGDGSEALIVSPVSTQISRAYSKSDVTLDQAQEKIGNEILEYLQINLVAGSGTAAEKLGTPERLILSLNARDEWRKFNPEGYNKYNELTDQLAQQIGEDNPYITLNRAYGLFQKLRIGLSEEPSKDIEKLDILLDEVLESDLRVNALHFKGIVELVFLSKDCDVAKNYAKQAIQLGRTVDAYTTTGTIYFLCKDYDLSIKSFRNALAVVPNDNGWFITRYLVPSMYRGGYIDGIKTILEPIIDATDMPANLLAYYSFIKLKEGDLDSAKLYLQALLAQFELTLPLALAGETKTTL